MLGKIKENNMTTYNVKVFYQSIRLNIMANIGGDVVVDTDKAVQIAQGTVKAETVQEACEKIFRNMNDPNIVIGYQEQCKKIGHSSMSIGDYVEVEGYDGVYVVACLGFKNVKTLDKVA